MWRTKQGSVQLLGAMAYCAPKQLGTCLPTIVPRLGEVLGDPHPKVQAAAQEALAQVRARGGRAGGWGLGHIRIRGPAALLGCPPPHHTHPASAHTRPPPRTTTRRAPPQVGSVIRNPEVQALVPALLAAISKPAEHTRGCLDTLLKTTFINTIDAPSLALVVPVVHRGLRDRSGDTKKRAARIVGNMCSLINDPKVRLRQPPGLAGQGAAA